MRRAFAFWFLLATCSDAGFMGVALADPGPAKSRFDCQTDDCFDRFDRQEKQAAAQKGDVVLEGRSVSAAPPARRSASDCRNVANDADRLKCFDAVVKSEAAPPSVAKPVETSSPEPLLGEQKLREKGIADGSIVVLKGEDLAAQTHKWEGKSIVTRLRCFYADVDDFRCINGIGGGRVDFSKLEPEARRRVIERDCDTMSKSTSDRCWIRVEFVYDHYNMLDTEGMLGSIVVVQPQDGTGKIILDDRSNKPAIRRTSRR